METTEAAPDLLNEVFRGGNLEEGRYWFWSCGVCGMGPLGKFLFKKDALSGRRRHEKSDRHIKNTTPKTQPETAQEAQQPELYEITLRGLGASQLADLCLLMAKWITEEGK